MVLFGVVFWLVKIKQLILVSKIFQKDPYVTSRDLLGIKNHASSEFK